MHDVFNLAQIDTMCRQSVVVNNRMASLKSASQTHGEILEDAFHLSLCCMDQLVWCHKRWSHNFPLYSAHADVKDFCAIQSRKLPCSRAIKHKTDCNTDIFLGCDWLRQNYRTNSITVSTELIPWWRAIHHLISHYKKKEKSCIPISLWGNSTDQDNNHYISAYLFMTFLYEVLVLNTVHSRCCFPSFFITSLL